MKILITGATGFVGSKLVETLFLRGFDISIITRDISKAQKSLMFPINFIKGDLNTTAVSLNQHFDVVINLMGENIGKKKWDEKQKKIILKSRAQTTKNLFDSLKNNQGITFIQAGAIGYYRDSLKDEVINEDTEQGDEFLSKVCIAWEKESEVFKNIFKNYTLLRIGVVLGRNGGLMHQALPLYRKALGGKLAGGKQWMSWIHVDDLVSLILYCIENKVNDVINAVSPNPIRNEVFNKVLAKYVQRPALFSVPEFLLKLIMGDQSYLALSSQRISSKIHQTDFKFKYSDIDSALKEITSFEASPPFKKERFHHQYRQAQFINLPIEKVFEFFSDAKNLERITPCYLNFKILEQSTKNITDKTIFKYRLKIHGLPVYWTTHITDWKENEEFSDYQAKGPYQTWYHTHTFIPCKQGTLMIDRVLYRLPFAFLGELFGLWLVKRDVPQIFSFRAQEMTKYLDCKSE